MSAVAPTDTKNFLGAQARVLADGLVEINDAPPGDMPPLHVHHTHDEGFYVLSGELALFMPDGQEVALGPGDFFLAPRGVPHVYRVSDAGPASWLVTSPPGTMDTFVAFVCALEDQDPESVTKLAAEIGVEILGPPGTMP
jgi:mannose-6-phosphate isomerase-like protein (cupin superfamily)